MNCREYDKATAEVLFSWIIDNEACLIQDDGVFVVDSFRELSPPDMAFDWSPAYDMDWQGRPNPLSAPALPIPFTASQLAACMLDGVGSDIQEAIGTRIGYPLPAGALSGMSQRNQFVRDVLEEAYALAEKAQQQVGEFNHDEWKQAGDREEEGNFDKFEVKWKAWRKAMVKQLLCPDSAPTEPSEQTVTQAAPAKPLQRGAAQDATILAAIRQAGYDPLALPKNEPGKSGVKLEIRNVLKGNSLFVGSTVFDKAWVRLKVNGDIVIVSRPVSP